MTPVHPFPSASRPRNRTGSAEGPGRRLRAGLVGAALLLTASACGEGQAEEASSVNLAEVVRLNLEITAEAAGELEPLRKVEVKSKASGDVLEVGVDVGDRVEPGDLLARIDPRDVQNDFNQAEADHEVALERLKVAEAQLERSRRLLDAGVITEQEHEGRSLEYANARAALVRAETNLALARLRMDDVTIRAPATGTVLERLVEEGTVIQSATGNVSGGTTLLTIANLDVMQVRTLVDETDVGRIEPGMPATVQVDAFPDREFTGEVEKIEPMARVEQNVVMFPVIVRLDNREGILKPGMSAEVSVLLAERPDALSLPNNAIVSFEEMAPAAAVLGVPENRLQFDRSVFQELTRELAGRQGEAGDREGSERALGSPPGEGAEAMAAIRDRIASGDLSQDEARAMIQERMGEAGGRRVAGPPGAGPGGVPSMGGERPARTPRGRQTGIGRPGVVFVMGADGALEPRPVLIGVSDWNNSEILVGVEEGERVAVVGGAQLQAQQQDRMGRFRSRMGGLPF